MHRPHLHSGATLLAGATLFAGATLLSSDAMATTGTDAVHFKVENDRGRLLHAWTAHNPCSNQVGPDLPISFIHAGIPFTVMLECDQDGVSLTVLGWRWPKDAGPPSLSIMGTRAPAYPIAIEVENWPADLPGRALSVTAAQAAVEPPVR